MVFARRLLSMLVFVYVWRHGFTIKLSKISSIRLPYAYIPEQYKLNSYSAKAIAYDRNGRIMYCVGRFNIHVIDVSDVTNMKIIHHIRMNGKHYLTDVEFCSGYVFVTIDDWDDRLNGRLHIYSRYDETNNEMKLLHSITVGVQPTMVLPTSDCKTVVVSIGAELDKIDGKVIDAEGGVIIIRFQKTPADNYTLKILNFHNFNARIESLEKDGVRFVNRVDGNTFANDAQPESITFNSDETKAFVSLQPNNAIAVVNLLSDEITSLHGLGYKDWKQYRLDLSDRDGGINLKSWPVYGMYQPDAIMHIMIAHTDYIVTANKGKSKEKKTYFTEEVRVKDITLSKMFEPNTTKRQELKKDEFLGRLKVSSITGYNVTSGAHDALYTFGGRGFSIWYADNMSMVYDSGEDISIKTALLFPTLFNCDVDEGELPLEQTDTKSDEKGEETKALAVANVEENTLIILGSKKPGLLTIYSIDENESTLTPKFEGMFHDIQRVDETWDKLVKDGNASMLAIDDIRFIPDKDSPNGHHIIAVTGTDSGTITLWELKIGCTDEDNESIKLFEELPYIIALCTVSVVIVVGILSTIVYMLVCRGCCCVGGAIVKPNSQENDEENQAARQNIQASSSHA